MGFSVIFSITVNIYYILTFPCTLSQWSKVEWIEMSWGSNVIWNLEWWKSLYFKIKHAHTTVQDTVVFLLLQLLMDHTILRGSPNCHFIQDRLSQINSGWDKLIFFEVSCLGFAHLLSSYSCNKILNLQILSVIKDKANYCKNTLKNHTHILETHIFYN